MKIEDIPAPIQAELAHLLSASRQYIESGKEVPPTLFVFEFENEELSARDVVYVGEVMGSGRGKALLLTLMEETVQRDKVGFVILLTEAWVASISAEEVKTKIVDLPVKDRADKREVLLASVMTKTQQYILDAPITRNPTQVGEFSLLNADEGQMDGNLVRDQEDTPKFH